MNAATNEAEFSALLDRYDLKKTRPRFSVLEVLKSRQAAISQPVLENMLGKDIDRVTLYRVLKTFEDKGIIHKVIDLHGTANYAMCNDNCSENDHHDEHVHFNCTVCFQVYCLDNFHIPEINMPDNFTAGSVNLIVYGMCANCNPQAEKYKKRKKSSMQK